jgi:hypothetical protein
MLLQNGSLFAAEPLNRLGGPDSSSTHIQWGRFGSRYSRWYSPALFSTALGEPMGYRPPVSWTMALDTGSLIVELNGLSALTGSGGATCSIYALTQLQSALTGGGIFIPGALISGYAIVASLSGSGDISSAIAYLSAQMNAAADGQGTLEADLVGIWSMLASLSGSSSFTTLVNAIGFTDAQLSGAGALLAAFHAKAQISADIAVTGELLTTSNVGAAVWQKLIDGDYSAEEILKILAAVNAGKSTGGGGTTIVFRDVNDTTDRVTATVDGNGNRTAITLDAG